MGYEYSAFNPVIWAIFLGFALVTLGIERAFRARNPDYPGKVPEAVANDLRKM